MPSLQLHMLRVAGVASIICENSKITIDKKSVIEACLLHDMGNIIKFNLNFLPEFLKPEGLEYWQNVQNEFKQKYGDDEHAGIYEIAKEVGVTEKTFELIKSVGFTKAGQNLKENNLEKSVCCYSDHRVTPSGVLPLEERMQEGRKRFATNKNVKESEEVFERLASPMRELESKIFSESRITPDYITDSVVNPLLESLKKFKIETK